MKIEITKSIIDQAQRRNSHRCMIADAIKSAVPSAKYISVDLQSVRFTKFSEKGKGKRFCYLTPPTAQVALLDFDQGRSVKPFNITLHAPRTRKAGWKANHPGSSRRGKVYHKTGRKRVGFPKIEREFGLRVLTK